MVSMTTTTTRSRGREIEMSNYIECDYAEVRCGICDYLASTFDEKMQNDPVWAFASYLVMGKHKKSTGHDNWRNVPKWGKMPPQAESSTEKEAGKE